MKNKPILKVHSYYNADDYDYWTECELTDLGDRGWKKGTSNDDEVTCKTA